MIVADTDVLSALGKIGKLSLVFQLFRTSEIMIPQAVYDELKASPLFEQLLPHFAGADQRIHVQHVPSPSVPEHFGAGECEAIFLAKREHAILLMDDRAAGKYAEENGITVIDIPTLLFLCKEQRLIAVADIAKIIQELQAKDYYAFAADVRAELLR